MRSQALQYRNSTCSANQPALGRRGFLVSVLATSLVSFIAPNVRAATSYSFKHGTFEITVLSDGHLVMPVARQALNAERAALTAALAAAGQHGKQIEPPCSVTLIRTGSEVILVDAGAGPHYMPTTGRLLANIAAAGVPHESITKVVYTHAHPDHLWGTLDDFDESPNFPNASYVIAAAEWNFWMADDVVAKLPED